MAGGPVEDLHAQHVFLQLVGLPCQAPLDGELEKPAHAERPNKQRMALDPS